MLDPLKEIAPLESVSSGAASNVDKNHARSLICTIANHKLFSDHMDHLSHTQKLSTSKESNRGKGPRYSTESSDELDQVDPIGQDWC